MKLRAISALIAGGLLAASMAAQAAPVRFNLVTDLQSPSVTGTFAGYITFDSADVFAGNTVSAAGFLDWGFTWGTDLAVSAATPGAAFSSGLDSITFDASAEITSWAICVTTPAGCGTSQDPGFYSDSSGNLNLTYGGGTFNSGVTQFWERAVDVPEPASMALAGIGLAALCGVRRRKSMSA